MTKILVVDDHAVVRDGVKRMFDEQPGTVAFGEASTPHEAIKLVSEQDWDIVVLDLALGERSGLEVLQELKKLRPKLPVLILSMYAEEQYARRAFKAGASGYITKDCTRAELVGAITQCSMGENMSALPSRNISLSTSKEVQPNHRMRLFRLVSLK